MINFCVFMVTAILNHNKYDMIVMHEMILNDVFNLVQLIVLGEMVGV